MKMMTCNQLGGACDKELCAETFEELAELSKQHGMEMYQQGDQAHIAAMKQMMQLMQQPGELEKWMEERRKEFAALPESK